MLKAFQYSFSFYPGMSESDSLLVGTEKGVTTDRQKGFSRGIRSFGKQEIKLIFKIAQDSNPISIPLGLFFLGGGA